MFAVWGPGNRPRAGYGLIAHRKLVDRWQPCRRRVLGGFSFGHYNCSACDPMLCLRQGWPCVWGEESRKRRAWARGAEQQYEEASDGQGE